MCVPTKYGAVRTDHIRFIVGQDQAGQPAGGWGLGAERIFQRDGELGKLHNGSGFVYGQGVPGNWAPKVAQPEVAVAARFGVAVGGGVAVAWAGMPSQAP